MTPYIDISVVDVLESAVAKLRNSGSVVDISDNGDGTYMFVTSYVGNISAGFVIKFSGCGVFDGEHKVVDSGTSYVVIAFKSGLEITTFGTFESITPEFHVEKWSGAKNEIYKEALSYIDDIKKFPCFLVLLDVHERLSNNIVEIPEVNIFVFDRCDPTAKVNDRRKSTFVKTLNLYKRFMFYLNSSKKLYGNFSHSKYDRFYLGTADKDQNKIGSIVDAVQITIENLKLINNSNNC